MGAVRATGHYKHFHKPWETIRQPASVIIAEPSSSGKSELVENLSKEKKTLIRPAPPPPPRRKRWSTVTIDGHFDLTT